MSDDPVRSVVDTDEGALDFQDYFVRRQCKPTFHGVRFQGAADAPPERGFREALDRARRHRHHAVQSVRQHRSDPGVAGSRDALRRPGRPVVAVSPIVGGKAVKGPLAQDDARAAASSRPRSAWRGTTAGWSTAGSSTTVDRELAPAIEALGCRVKVCNTIMRTLDDKRRLAQDAVELAFELATEAVG